MHGAALPEYADTMSSFVLLPIVDHPGENMVVYDDGSYARWTPRDIAD